MKSASPPTTHVTSEIDATSRRFVKQLICRLFGHRVVNRRLGEAQGRVRLCSCGEPLLREHGAAVHVRHNLACFFAGHAYTKTAERDDHCEFICNDCGHPLLFEQETSPYARREYFRKFVRHRCGWFGHAVHTVSERCGLTEYACHCGHSFLLEAEGLTKVRHPLVCMITGHRLSPLTRRNDHLELRCGGCGHPFCLTDGIDQRQSQPLSEPSSSAVVKRNALGDWLKLIRFRYHLSFIGVVLGAALIAKGLPPLLLLSLLVLYMSFNVLLYGAFTR